ncbi:hypothetical protein Zmor_010207 [Zophobas morio]|uniref:Uncharacterized protein n=1 Tax=Zophobas morio TaxID=2755281 RepID=A0AA38IJY8_9CUCU|nr:hypothetical protein Zmor_010207 [Zophobas morio]
MKSNLCFLIIVLVLVGTVLAEDSNYQNWFAKIFGQRIESGSEKLVPKSIIRVRCRQGFVRIGRRCLPIEDDYDYR